MKNRVTVNLNSIAKVNKFVNEMTKFESDIDIISGRYICDSKSVMGVLSYDLSKPVDVQIHSDTIKEIIRFNEVLKEFM